MKRFRSGHLVIKVFTAEKLNMKNCFHLLIHCGIEMLTKRVAFKQTKDELAVVPLVCLRKFAKILLLTERTYGKLLRATKFLSHSLSSLLCLFSSPESAPQLYITRVLYTVRSRC